MIDEIERFEDHPEYKQKVEEYTEKLKDLELSDEDLREIIALNRTIFYEVGSYRRGYQKIRGVTQYGELNIRTQDASFKFI